MEFCWIWEDGCHVEGVAAWVQAIGSIGAILASGWIASYQGRMQFDNAMKLFMTEKRHAHLEMAKTLEQLANNCRSAIKLNADKLTTREAVHNAADDGKPYIDLEELHLLERAIGEIHLINLPHPLANKPLMLRSYVRQFREIVEQALATHRIMTDEHFNEFFGAMNAIQAGLELTCRDIVAEVGKVQAVIDTA